MKPLTTITLLLITAIIYQCDLCGFYRNTDEIYCRVDRNPNYLQQSWTNNVNNVCKYCIYRLNYPERNLFKLKEEK